MVQLLFNYIFWIWKYIYIKNFSCIDTLKPEWNLNSYTWYFKYCSLNLGQHIKFCCVQCLYTKWCGLVILTLIWCCNFSLFQYISPERLSHFVQWVTHHLQRTTSCPTHTGFDNIYRHRELPDVWKREDTDAMKWFPVNPTPSPPHPRPAMWAWFEKSLPSQVQGIKTMQVWGLPKPTIALKINQSFCWSFEGRMGEGAGFRPSRHWEMDRVYPGQIASRSPKSLDYCQICWLLQNIFEFTKKYLNDLYQHFETCVYLFLKCFNYCPIIF